MSDKRRKIKTAKRHRRFVWLVGHNKLSKYAVKNQNAKYVILEVVC